MSFEELQIGMSTPTEIVGEVVAGEAAQTLKQIKNLVKGISSNTFDLAVALHKVKKNRWYAPKYLTFTEYIGTLDLKSSKGHYLVRIAQTMEDVGIPRMEYEAVGIAKLRAICRLDLQDSEGNPKQYEGVPAVEVIKDLIQQAPAHSPEAVDETVKKLQGLMGEDAQVWQNISLTVAQRKKWREAVDLAKLNIGSVGKDDEGNYKDPSEGACMEVIALSYLLDPNNRPEGEAGISEVDGSVGEKESGEINGTMENNSGV
jgi:hypothetical protein